MYQRIVVIGQSHVRALREGFELLITERPSLTDSVEAAFVVARPDRVVRFNVTRDDVTQEGPQKSLDRVVAQCKPTRVVLAWGGNQMNLRALVATDRPFDVVLPDSDGPPALIDPGVEILPCAAVDAFVQDRLESNEMLSRLLIGCAQSALPVGVLLPPPPIPEPAVRQRLAREPHFVRVLEALGTDAASIPIVPESVRQRLWTLMAGSYRSFADRHGLQVLEPPGEVFDASGLLASQFWSEDVTHANAAYGAAVLRRTVDWAATAPASAPAGGE